MALNLQTIPNFKNVTVTPGSIQAIWLKKVLDEGKSVRAVQRLLKTSATFSERTKGSVDYWLCYNVRNNITSVCKKCGDEYYSRVKVPTYCSLECRPGNNTSRRGKGRPPKRSVS